MIQRLVKFLLAFSVWSVMTVVWATAPEPVPDIFDTTDTAVTVSQLPEPDDAKHSVEVNPVRDPDPVASYGRWLALIAVLGLLMGILLLWL